MIIGEYTVSSEYLLPSIFCGNTGTSDWKGNVQNVQYEQYEHNNNPLALSHDVEDNYSKHHKKSEGV